MPNIGPLNSKEKGDQREASALRDEVCHIHPSIPVFIAVADSL